jgi:hypothetical protein
MSPIAAGSHGALKAVPKQSRQMSGRYTKIDGAKRMRNIGPPQRVPRAIAPNLPAPAIVAKNTIVKSIGLFGSGQQYQIPANDGVQHLRIKPTSLAGARGIKT